MEASNQSVDNLLLEIDQSIAASRDTMSQKSVTDCPICIMPLTDQGLYRKNLSSRPTVLLSCSHVFHATCLQAFEEFSFEKRRECPVCRSSYHKKIM